MEEAGKLLGNVAVSPVVSLYALFLVYRLVSEAVVFGGSGRAVGGADGGAGAEAGVAKR